MVINLIGNRDMSLLLHIFIDIAKLTWLIFLHYCPNLDQYILEYLIGPKPSEAATVFTIINNCKETVWPGVTPGDNFNGGGFVLKPKQSMVFTTPFRWSGRIWGRTGCNFNKNGVGSCQTGDCDNTLKCSASGKTPASLAKFAVMNTLKRNTLASLDFYHVSLVDGFNLPITVTPINGRGNCSVAGCDGDLRSTCPAELSIRAKGKTVGCRRACDVFNTDEYCCRGVYRNPVVCQPTFYSKKFKEACPKAYSYAYDDLSSIFTCSGADYIIAFCSNRSLNIQILQFRALLFLLIMPRACFMPFGIGYKTLGPV